MEQPKKNLHLIQVLRGIASLLVVLLHVTGSTNDILNKKFCFNFFLFGGSGVDIFFVLSGFIITYTSIKGVPHINKLLPFVRKRFVRIFPTYWIIITLFLVIQITLPSFYKSHYNFSIGNILSTYLLMPDHNMVNGVSWTLTYELFFYLLFSFVFIFPNKKLAFTLAIIYGIAIIIIPIWEYNLENKNAWIGLLGFPMNLEFIMGISIVALLPRISPAMGSLLIITGGLLFLAGGIFSNFHYHQLPNVFSRVILFGIPATFIITGLVKWELSKNIIVHNFLLTLGEASYSLYLLHLPLVVASIKIIAKFHIQNNIILHVLLFVMIVTICYASILFYKWIERPVINKLNAALKKQNTHSRLLNKSNN